ncbi:3-deoxy-7-phosphoheptulonate synthase [Embleya sp. NBC_00888]|uniref:3-deoxy-7-phosphoheptulonate synthase n=1 Tax=Embleya sp. NBC_00888 TaxID=2975960 RepID=UPI00386D80DA|nr:3-deoxy-7-phosphoheptulonate synthase [Embleya sp. NBC_00888]
MSLSRNSDSRVTAVDRLMSPTALRKEIPIPPETRKAVLAARRDVKRILNGKDDRLVLVTGPCSIHDTEAALVYAERLAEVSRRVADRLLIVMRVYVEKPRTRMGWKGLVSDPGLDGSFDLNTGLRMARGLMVRILETGLPIGCEFLDPMIARYFADAVSWASIGARTVQSQVHRQLTSGLDMPVGIKNTTAGRTGDAIDAIVTASNSHVFPSVTDDGQAAVVTTSGNPDCHVVLRGGTEGPNYSAPDVAETLDQLQAAGLPGRLVIDASHGNSGKDHEEQTNVVEDVAERIADGESGVAGMMIESFLACGRQDLILGRTDGLAYGQSVTDACAGWEQTTHMVECLAEAVTARRAADPSVMVA